MLDTTDPWVGGRTNDPPGDTTNNGAGRPSNVASGKMPHAGRRVDLRA
jgi:hypothetical protein